ncbi:hypothetical protein RR48_12725 [Papilio machaon]|uniref:Kazal-like domain-containing protein n=1 Tax=Papilio machaon TaxID=76193 RepID=A0A194QQV0_PAPMA|nr:hypothetical protein RR48_12725 [Papilio machaon]
MFRKYENKYAIIVVIYSQAAALYCPLRSPVCATDGKTYPTVCHLKLVAAEVSDLQVLHDGPCYLAINKNDGFREKNNNLKRTEDKNETTRNNKKENDRAVLLETTRDLLLLVECTAPRQNGTVLAVSGRLENTSTALSTALSHRSVLV